MDTQLQIFCSLVCHCETFDELVYLRSIAECVMTDRDFMLFMFFAFGYLGRCAIDYRNYCINS